MSGTALRDFGYEPERNGAGWVTPAADLRSPTTFPEHLEFWASVFVIFTFSQGWAAPLTGWAVDPTKLTLLKVGFLPAYLVVLVLGAMRPIKTVTTLVRTPLIYGLVALAGASMLWSIDGGATSRRTVALIFTTLAGTVLASRWPPDRLAEIIGAQFLASMALSFMFAVLPPHHGIMTELFPGAWRGVWTEKNGLGAMMALGSVACLAAAFMVRERRLVWLMGFFGCLVLVLLSQSKTSLLALVLGSAAIFGVWLLQRGPIWAVATTWLAVAGGLALAAVAFLAPELIFDGLNKDATLTGRTNIWVAAIRQANLHNPTLGFGYGVLWDHKQPFYPGAWIAHDAGFAAGHAHNGWLEVWLGLGYVGLGLWTLSYLRTSVRVIGSAYRSMAGYLALPFFLIFSVMTVTEVSILDYQDVTWVIYVMIAAALVQGSRPLRPDAPAG